MTPELALRGHPRLRVRKLFTSGQASCRPSWCTRCRCSWSSWTSGRASFQRLPKYRQRPRGNRQTGQLVPQQKRQVRLPVRPRLQSSST